MTSPTANAETTEQVPASEPTDSAKPTASIPAFRFPFSPATFAPNKDAEPAWHQRSNKSSHDKTPGRAPNGTRRSMGKR